MNSISFEQFKTTENMPETGSVIRLPSTDEIAQCRYSDAIFESTCAKNINGNILEIGTSFGKGTADFARNTTFTVFTVNPLPEQLPEMKMITHRIGQDEIGKCYREEGLTNVIQIYENSKDLKLNKDMGIMLVFVDGNHTSEFAYMDAVKCFDVLEVGGYLIWHDTTPKYRDTYGWVNAVMLGMERFCREHSYDPVHVDGTWCSYIKKRIEYEL